jgi:hypothetical protein
MCPLIVDLVNLSGGIGVPNDDHTHYSIQLHIV